MKINWYDADTCRVGGSRKSIDHDQARSHRGVVRVSPCRQDDRRARGLLVAAGRVSFIYQGGTATGLLVLPSQPETEVRVSSRGANTSLHSKNKKQPSPCTTTVSSNAYKINPTTSLSHFKKHQLHYMYLLSQISSTIVKKKILRIKFKITRGR